MKRTSHILSLMLGFFAFTLMASSADAADLRDWGTQFNDGKKRFVVLKDFNDEAVLDLETQLVWLRSPVEFSIDGIIDETDKVGWSTARGRCISNETGNRKGWKLPAVDQLASLLDLSVPFPGPRLSVNHPFIDAQSDVYWAAQGVPGNADLAWTVAFSNGSVQNLDKKFGQAFIWCVRGAPWGPDVY